MPDQEGLYMSRADLAARNAAARAQYLQAEEAKAAAKAAASAARRQKAKARNAERYANQPLPVQDMAYVMQPVASDCRTVRKSGKPKRGCTCHACQRRRHELTLLDQARRDREALAELEHWLKTPTASAPTTLRRVLGRRVNQWANIDWLRIFWQDHNIDPNACAYCGQPMEVIDHVQPVAKGGGSEFSNLLPACQPCNSSKAAHEPLDWVRQHRPKALETVTAYLFNLPA